VKQKTGNETYHHNTNTKTGGHKIRKEQSITPHL